MRERKKKASECVKNEVCKENKKIKKKRKKEEKRVCVW